MYLPSIHSTDSNKSMYFSPSLFWRMWILNFSPKKMKMIPRYVVYLLVHPFETFKYKFLELCTIGSGIMGSQSVITFFQLEVWALSVIFFLWNGMKIIETPDFPNFFRHSKYVSSWAEIHSHKTPTPPSPDSWKRSYKCSKLR